MEAYSHWRGERLVSTNPGSYYGVHTWTLKTRKNDRPNIKAVLDIDYDHRLSKEDRDWLNNFINAEYYQDKKATKKILGRKHTRAERKKITDAENARRRDIYMREKRTTLSDLALVGETPNSENEDNE